MNRNWKCPECWVLGGQHASHCQSRGYQSVGPHPDAPPPSTQRIPSPFPPVLCCGGTRNREGCEYHDPKLQPQAPASESGPYDYATPDAWIDIPGCNCGRCR